MAKSYETLLKKDDPTVEVYPNIESQNIPSNAVTTDKIAANAVTTDKIANGAVTGTQISNNSIGSAHIQNGTVGYSQLSTDVKNTLYMISDFYNEEEDSVSCDTVNASAISVDADLYLEGTMHYQNDPTVRGDFTIFDVATFKEVPVLDADTHTYAIVVGENEDLNLEGVLGFTQCDLSIYSSSDINDALDFDQSSAAWWTTTYASIVETIFEGIVTNKYGYDSGNRSLTIRSSTRSIHLSKSGTYQWTLSMYENSSRTCLFYFELDTQSHTVTNYTNTNNNYVYFALYPLKMFN